MEYVTNFDSTKVILLVFTIFLFVLGGTIFYYNRPKEKTIKTVPRLPPLISSISSADIEPQTDELYKYPLWKTSITSLYTYDLLRAEFPYSSLLLSGNIRQQNIFNNVPENNSPGYPLKTVFVVPWYSNETQFAISLNDPLQINNNTLNPYFTGTYFNQTGPFLPSFGFVNATDHDVGLRLDNNFYSFLTIPSFSAVLAWPVRTGSFSPYNGYFVPNTDGYFPNCKSLTGNYTELEVLIMCAALEAEASNLDATGYTGPWPLLLSST